MSSVLVQRKVKKFYFDIFIFSQRLFLKKLYVKGKTETKKEYVLQQQQKNPFLYSFQGMGFTLQLFFSAKGLCYYPWLLFSDGISLVGHYPRGAYFWKMLLNAVGGMVTSIKMPKERRNVKIEEVVLRKSS